MKKERMYILSNPDERVGHRKLSRLAPLRHSNPIRRSPQTHENTSAVVVLTGGGYRIRLRVLTSCISLTLKQYVKLAAPPRSAPAFESFF